MPLKGMSANWRLVRSVACLCLPTIAVVAFGVRFLVVDVPKMVREDGQDMGDFLSTIIENA